MTTLDALLSDILAHPDDDFPRLVYADYLDDHGGIEQAEFIRQQIRVESAEMNAQQCKNWLGSWADEQVLFTRDFTSNTIPGIWTGRCVFRSASVRNNLFWNRQDRQGLLFVSRGFIARVQMPLGVWLKYGRGIVKNQPVTFVEIDDRVPYHSSDGLYYWTRESHEIHPVPVNWMNESYNIHSVPVDLLRLTANPEDGKVSGYANHQEAMSELSRACLEWAGVKEGFDDA